MTEALSLLAIGVILGWLAHDQAQLPPLPCPDVPHCAEAEVGDSPVTIHIMPRPQR